MEPSVTSSDLKVKEMFRRKNTNMNTKCIIPILTNGGVLVMLWGTIVSLGTGTGKLRYILNKIFEYIAK